MGQDNETLPDDPELTARLECARRVDKAALDPQFRVAIPGGAVAAMLPEDSLKKMFGLLADSPDSEGMAIRIAVAGPGEDDVLVAQVTLVYMTPEAAHHHPSDVGDDGLTDDERAVYAQRWKSGLAADLHSDVTASLRDALRQGKLPTRHLRPAG